MGDSDLFSLELPGAMASKKSTDSLHMDDDLDMMDSYGESPLDRRRRPEKARDGRKQKGESPGYHGMEFGGSRGAYDSPNEFLEEDDPISRRRGLSALGEAATSSTASMEYFDDRSMVADFLRQYHCTSMMPQSSKVVVLDVGLSIRAAFHALDENGTNSSLPALGRTTPAFYTLKLRSLTPLFCLALDIDSATLWCSQEHDYVGVVTIGDLLAALLSQISDPTTIDDAAAMKTLERMTLKQWMDKRNENRDLVCMEPSDSLFEALSMLSRFKVHRVPVIDRLEQNIILYVLTATKIVVFLMKIVRSTFLPPMTSWPKTFTDLFVPDGLNLQMAKRPALFETSLERLQVGRFSGLTTAWPDTSLFNTLLLIEKTHFSAIPIVSADGVLVDTIYKSDLARIPPSELLASASTPIAQVLQDWRQKGILRTYSTNTCTIEDTMEVVLTSLMDSRLRSLVVVDSSKVVKGIIALTDVLRCFLV